MRGGAVAARQAHNLEVAGSNPAPASGPDLGSPGPPGNRRCPGNAGSIPAGSIWIKRPPSRRRPPLNLPLPGGAQEQPMAELRNFRQLFVFSKLGCVPEGVDLNVFQDWQIRVIINEKLDFKVAEGLVKEFLPFLRKKDTGYKCLENDVVYERYEMLSILKRKFEEFINRLGLEKGLREFRKFRYECSDALIHSLIKMGLKYVEVVELAKLFLNEVDVRYLRLLPKVLQDVVVCVLASFSDNVTEVARSLLRRDAVVFFPDSLFLNESE
jgi:hypothetical protein